MTNKISIKYCWHTFNVAEAIAAFIPFKSKKYVKKLGKVCPNDIYKIFIEHACHNNLKATIVQYYDITAYGKDMPSPMYVYGISMQDMWDNVLETLAKYKNMKNVEELCIWLDMKDI